MSPSLLTTVIAVISAVVLLLQQRDPLRITLLVVSAIQLARTLGWLTIGLRGFPLGEVLALALAINGALVYFRSSSKSGVTAATCITLIGTIQSLTLLHVLR